MRPRTALVHAGVLAALVGLAAGVRFVAVRAAASAMPRRVAALPAIPFLEVCALGYREAAADVAWLQAVQYYGEHRQGGNDLADFEHSVAAVNALDPRFQHAYLFGAFVLATEKQDLPGALELLRRGARANPDSPVCPFEMGFLTYVGGGDQEAALHYMALAAQLPGGRERAMRFMAYLNRRLGRLETSWMLWNDIYRSSRDPSMRAIAAASMRRLQTEMGRQP
jgi:hypothetical protein